MKSHDFPTLIAEASIWAQEREREILACGRALQDSDVIMARRVGVQRAELVRVEIVPSLPLPPRGTKLRQLMEGMNFQSMDGLTLGYGIYIVQGRLEKPLLCHELRHVQQYERMGGLVPFLQEYLDQVIFHGYFDAPLEADARAHERFAW
jgi:hypothetical protein